ncbi:hypothetical protein K402DRAFT_456750 [Aulographum hederae CBS 113979]|uniref:Uncharacterized protein n=1 Tax=Aulographum hederae CBS 113979 TaxID=1176131 RepID=A0A6G1GRB9_9PEZI|nr:hypothetical protein K402DRAFT_456750 [Aulographum hederae CBS 113979]
MLRPQPRDDGWQTSPFLLRTSMSSIHFLLSSIAITLLWSSQIALVAADDGGTPIPITTYTDSGDSHCLTPSTTSPNVTLPLGICAVTPGMGSLNLPDYPCANAIVQPYVFSDTACGTEAVLGYFQSDTCYAVYKGAMAAIMLSCDHNNPETPVGTTTIAVGAVATQGAAGGGTPVASGGGGGSSITPSSAASPTNTNTDSDSDPGSPAKNGWSSLDYGARVGIIVALAVGIPPIVIAAWALMYACKGR